VNQRVSLSKKDSILYCFYDLSVSYANYDFFQFLQLAELHRKRHGQDKLFLIFTAGTNDKFQHSDEQGEVAMNSQMIMSNFLIPSCWLLPSCVNVAWLRNEEEVNVFFDQVGSTIFPITYNPQLVIVQPMTKCSMYPDVTAAYLRDEEFSVFEEPEEYTNMVVSYLSCQPESRKVITVTFSATDCDPAVRTQIYREWEGFLGTLAEQEYRVIIVPDDYRSWQQSPFSKYECCETATVNVLFRAALYRHAYLNMFIDSSCADSVRWTGASSLVFNQISRQVTSSLPWFRSILGVDFGDQLPMTSKRHVLVWGTQTKELIKSEFDKFTAEFSDNILGQANGRVTHGIQSIRQQRLLCESALNYISEKMSVLVEQEHIDTIKAIIRLDPDYALPRYLLGLVAAQIGDFDDALQLLDDCIILSNNGRNPDFDRACRSLKAEVFEKLDNSGQALQEYLELNKKYPENTEILDRISVLKKTIPKT